MCGSNLESEAGIGSVFMELMAEQPSSENVNIIVQTGGSYRWNNANPAFDKTAVQNVDIPNYALGRYKIENNKIRELGEVELASMGSADTLADFIKFGKEKFPAKKYMFVMWDHGYVEPYGCMQHEELFYNDQNGNTININDLDVKHLEQYTNDNLTLPEFREALEKGGVEFEVFGFNTCLSSSMEIASAVAPYGKYMVASAESIPAAIGLPVGYIGYLNEKPECDGYELGNQICNMYVELIDYYTPFLSDDVKENFTKGTMSLIDLSYMPEMETYYSDILKEIFMSSYDSKHYAGFQTYALSCESYGSEGNTAGNLVDLRSFLTNSSTLLNNTKSDEELIKLIDKAVVCKNGPDRFQTYGISFFFPNMNYIKGVRNQFEAQLKLLGIYDDYTEEQMEEIITQYIQQSFDGYLENIEHIDGYYWYASYLAHRFEGYWNIPDSVTALVDQNLDDEHKNKEKVTVETSKIEYEFKYDETGTIYLDITEGKENVLSVEVSCAYFLYMPQYNTFSYNLMGTQVVEETDEDSDSYQYKYTFENTWIRINNRVVGCFIVENTPDYTVYGLPAKVNDQYAFIFAQYNKADQTFDILYAMNTDENYGLANNEMYTLQPGDKIEDVYYVLQFNSKHQLEFCRVTTLFDPYEFNDDVQVDIGPAFANFNDNNNVLISFIIRDSFGNSYQTESAVLWYDGDMNLKDVTDDEKYDEYGDLYKTISE